MSFHSSTNLEIKQLYINGHFAMSSSLALSPMGSASSGISLFITRTLCSLILTLLLKRNPILLMKIKTFLGDATFDTIGLFEALLSCDTFGANRHFQKAYIPLNSRKTENNVKHNFFSDLSSKLQMSIASFAII